MELTTSFIPSESFTELKCFHLSVCHEDTLRVSYVEMTSKLFVQIEHSVPTLAPLNIMVTKILWVNCGLVKTAHLSHYKDYYEVLKKKRP